MFDRLSIDLRQIFDSLFDRFAVDDGGVPVDAGVLPVDAGVLPVDAGGYSLDDRCIFNGRVGIISKDVRPMFDRCSTEFR